MSGGRGLGKPGLYIYCTAQYLSKDGSNRLIRIPIKVGWILNQKIYHDLDAEGTCLTV